MEWYCEWYCEWSLTSATGSFRYFISKTKIRFNCTILFAYVSVDQKLVISLDITSNFQKFWKYFINILLAVACQVKRFKIAVLVFFFSFSFPPFSFLLLLFFFFVSWIVKKHFHKLLIYFLLIKCDRNRTYLIGQTRKSLQISKSLNQDER